MYRHFKLYFFCSYPNLDGIYFNPVVNFGEVRRVQLAKSTLLISTLVSLGIFSDLLSSVQRKQREAIGIGIDFDICP